MITTRLKGGLGNQLFQYAAGLAMALKFKDTLSLDITGYEEGGQAKFDTLRKYRLFPFAISGNVAVQEEALRARNPYGIVSRVLRVFNQKILRKFYLDFDPDIFEKKRTYIEGFFQSEKNFIDIGNVIRKEFTLKKEFESAAFQTKKNSIVNDAASVAVHIRRGDYVKDKVTNSYFGTCSKEYYVEAIQYMNSKVKDPTLYFFSDDIEWVKQEFKDVGKAVFVSDGTLEDYEELILMSLCSHNIIANSSFSWWGAWLNRNEAKIIVAPKKWLNVVPDPQPNLIPSSWIRL